MTTTITQRRDLAAAHRHDSRGRLHGHNFQLSATVSGALQASGIVLEAAALDARLTELAALVSGNNSIEAIWLRAQAGWPKGVAATAVTLVETSGAGSSIE